MLELSLRCVSSGASHLVFAVVGPDVVQTRGREKRRRMGEEFTAVAYREEHLRTTHTQKTDHVCVLTTA